MNKDVDVQYKNITKLEEQKKPKGSIGLIKGISFVFGNILGSGIFISVNETFNILSSNNIFSVLLVWLFGGAIALLGSLCYAELGGRLQKTGGETVYYNEAIGGKFSVLFAIMFVFVIKTITIAAISLTAAKYFVYSLPIEQTSSNDYIVKVVAVGILFLCMIINCITKKVVTNLSVFFLIFKILAVLLVVGPGIYKIIIGSVQDWTPPFEWSGFEVSKLSMAIVNVCWSFEGWNSLGLIAGEVDKASTLLFSSLIGVSGVVLAYLLTVVSYSAVLGYDLVRTSETVALSFAKKFYGQYYWIISVLITLSAMGSINGTFYTLGGVTVYSGYMSFLPRAFSLVYSSTRIPLLSMIAIAFVSFCFVFIKFQVLLRYCAFVTWVFYFLSFLSLWIIKIRKNDSTIKEKSEVETSSKIFTIHYVFILPVMAMCIYMVVACFATSLIGCFVIAGLMALIYFLQFVKWDKLKFDYCASFQDKFYNKLQKWFKLVPADEKDIS